MFPFSVVGGGWSSDHWQQKFPRKLHLKRSRILGGANAIFVPLITTNANITTQNNFMLSIRTKAFLNFATSDGNVFLHNGSVVKFSYCPQGGSMIS